MRSTHRRTCPLQHMPFLNKLEGGTGAETFRLAQLFKPNFKNFTGQGRRGSFLGRPHLHVLNYYGCARHVVHTDIVEFISYLTHYQHNHSFLPEDQESIPHCQIGEPIYKAHLNLHKICAEFHFHGECPSQVLAPFEHHTSFLRIWLLWQWY